MEQKGFYHPLTVAIRDFERIFRSMGFSVATGPEIEDEWHNFTALNVPKDHPARDMQDTFWLPDGRVLRTHTSPVQIRYMETHEPPIRIIVPGKVYRNEATDMTHEAQFYQLEGLVVSEDTTLAHLKGVLETFFREFFGGTVEVRLRPSFFGFTEPSVEVDMRLTGEHVTPKLRDRWIEVMGAGMVHPNVLNNAGIDPKRYQGFAFGGGVERLCMLKWGIDDVRLFHTGDLRLTMQFPTK
ncbi:MAG: phenylalanine--tRNA ligase subunit alpha [Candidatus Campbellbacteria bacterium]|nr:phenylalanine--tRNA ligase subunit alpha [Candidatus Campbellbacteria bacterium]